MTKEELLSELDTLAATAEARKAASRDPFLIGLHPSASDWMTAAEIARLSELHAALVPFGWEEREEARARVAVKRAARRAQRASEKITPSGDVGQAGRVDT